MPAASNAAGARDGAESLKMDKLLLFVSVFSTFGARLSLQHYDDKYGNVMHARNFCQK